MLGAIFGDIVGSVYERQPHKSVDFPLFTSESRFTDDTVMTVAIADCLLHHKPYRDTLQAWGLRYPNRGYGGRFKNWLENPIPYESYGNGSAMRVSPIGWLHQSEVLLQARFSAAVSHNHIEGIFGAQAVAWAIWIARQGTSTPKSYMSIRALFGYDLSRTTTEIRPNYKFDVSCQGSVPEAIICALEASSVEEAVRLAVSLGGDADTQASIAGAIAEARFGFPSELREEVFSRIPEEMKNIVLEFEKTFQ